MHLKSVLTLLLAEVPHFDNAINTGGCDLEASIEP